MKKGTRAVIKARSRDRIVAFVRLATEVLQRALVGLGIEESKAADAARDMVHDICAAHGAGFMYVPRDLEFELTRRDREIYERFVGTNLHELAQEYRLTHVRIYQIVAQVKAEELRQRQGRLPGLDDPDETL